MSSGQPATHERPIVVCGMYRSGTSLLAQLVHRWGAFGGDPAWLASGDESNPRGYWQSRRLGKLVSRMHRETAIHPWHPAFDEEARAMAADPRYRDEALRILADMRSAGGPWFLKDPQLTVWLPFWKELWGSAIYVITVRHPLACALSWEKYSVPPEYAGRMQVVAAALQQWQFMMLSALRHTDDAPSRYFAVYEDLVAAPARECRRLAGFLGAACGAGAPGEAQVEAMADAISPDLQRSKVPCPFDEVALATDGQKALYRYLRAKAATPDLPFEASRYDVHPGWREYLDNLQILRSLYRQLRGIEAREVLPAGVE